MALRVVDQIAGCLEPAHQMRQISRWSGEMIHRFSVPGVHDAIGVASVDRGVDDIGNRMAYNFVINREGVTYQALPVSLFGWHARRYSRRWIAIALLGDFQEKPPPDRQYWAMVELLAVLSIAKCRIKFAGHTDLHNASKDPTKVCPGRAIDMGALHDHVKERLCGIGDTILRASGVSL